MAIVTSPGKLIVMTPPKPQLAMEDWLRAGAPPNIMVGEPGAQTEVTGVQGRGTNTPKAAAVAAATAGLARLVQRPKGRILTKGTAQVMLPAGAPPPMVRVMGRTSRADGARPNVH